MMKQLGRAMFLGAVGVVMACSVGCGGSSDPERPAVKELKEGLNILQTDNAIVGAFRKGDHAIYFETRAGAKTLDVYRNLDPSLPEQEMDMRVMDENGRTFYIQKGGDTLPEAWDKELVAEESRPRVDPIVRAEHFEMLKEATAAMEVADLPVVLKAHKATVVGTKLAIRDDMLRPAVEKAVKDLSKGVQNLQRSLQFSVDESSGRTVIKVVDKDTQEVIRQIPEQQVLELAARLDQSAGVFVQDEA